MLNTRTFNSRHLKAANEVLRVIKDSEFLSVDLAMCLKGIEQYGIIEYSKALKKLREHKAP